MATNGQVKITLIFYQPLLKDEEKGGLMESETNSTNKDPNSYGIP
jgi:hypothetical protein